MLRWDMVESGMQDMSYGMHDGDMEGDRVQSVVGWMQGMGYGLQWDVGCWMQDMACGVYDMGYRTQVMGHWR